MMNGNLSSQGSCPANHSPLPGGCPRHTDSQSSPAPNQGSYQMCLKTEQVAPQE